MLIPRQTDGVERVTEQLDEVSRHEGARRKVTSSAGGCSPRRVALLITLPSSLRSAY